MLKVKIKAKGKDAKKLLGGALPDLGDALVASGAKIPDASGSNYVSPNTLHTPTGVSGQGKRKLTRGSERVKPTGQETSFQNPRDLHNYPTSDQYRAQRFPTLRLGAGQVSGELDDMTVKPVNRVMNPVEAVRRRNNATRDARTNLGRGKSGLVVSNEGSAADGVGKW